MRKALVVGIDYYEHVGSLYGCVSDAHSVKAVLARHSDGSVNFAVRDVTGTGPADPVTRTELKSLVEQVFASDGEIALFYFAGHSQVGNTGGYLTTSECRNGDDGLALDEVLQLANASPARNRIIVLDSCFAGVAGTSPLHRANAEIAEGVTILSAATADQYAAESDSGGVFTTLFVDALSGGATNLVGDITPGSVYAYVDQSLGAWQQRPVFKTHVKEFVSLRNVQPPIGLADLRRITEFFPESGSEYDLDPSYEPESDAPDPTNTQSFAVLQAYNRVNLVVPVDAPHMYHAAMEGKSCRLTVLGEHYRRLVEDDRI